MHPPINTPEGYTFTTRLPPAPEGVAMQDWQPTWTHFRLEYKNKLLLSGQVALNQMDQVQAEVIKTISRHQLERRYNRSLAGIWNNYPVDWMWWLLHRLGFKYCAGGRSQTHIFHFFARSYGEYGVLVRWKGKAGGASFPRLFVAPVQKMMQGIEHGDYET